MKLIIFHLCSDNMIISHRSLLLFLLQLASLANITNTDSSCGELGNCDYLVTVSTFQIGTCGRAARCYWELRHFKKALKGETADEAEYENNIKDALCKIATYGMYKETSIKKKHKIFETEMPDPDNDTFDHYPMPTLYFIPKDPKAFTVIPEIEVCRSLEATCIKELDKEVNELCAVANTPENIKKIEDNINLKVRGKSAYRMSTDKDASPDHNKCSLLILTRTKVNQKFEDSYMDSVVHGRLRPPYFDLYLLYMLDPLEKFKDVPLADRYWNETKAYSDLGHSLPEKMIKSIHAAIQHIYDLSKTSLTETERNETKRKYLLWEPEKFCYSSTVFLCVDKAKLKNTNCE